MKYIVVMLSMLLSDFTLTIYCGSKATAMNFCAESADWHRCCIGCGELLTHAWKSCNSEQGHNM